MRSNNLTLDDGQYEKILQKSIHPLDRQPKATVRRRNFQYQTANIVTVLYPEPQQTLKNNLCMKIKILFKLPGQNKVKMKSINFGYKESYVFSKDISQRMKTLARFKLYQQTKRQEISPFKSFFWQVMLLNRCQTIQQAWLYIDQHFNKKQIDYEQIKHLAQHKAQMRQKQRKGYEKFKQTQQRTQNNPQDAQLRDQRKQQLMRNYALYKKYRLLRKDK